MEHDAFQELQKAVEKANRKVENLKKAKLKLEANK